MKSTEPVVPAAPAGAPLAAALARLVRTLARGIGVVMRHRNRALAAIDGEKVSRFF
jgi:hypothetical protein